MATPMALVICSSSGWVSCPGRRDETGRGGRPGRSRPDPRRRPRAAGRRHFPGVSVTSRKVSSRGESWTGDHRLPANQSTRARHARCACAARLVDLARRTVAESPSGRRRRFHRGGAVGVGSDRSNGAAGSSFSRSHGSRAARPDRRRATSPDRAPGVASPRSAGGRCCGRAATARSRGWWPRTTRGGWRRGEAGCPASRDRRCGRAGGRCRRDRGADRDERCRRSPAPRPRSHAPGGTLGRGEDAERVDPRHEARGQPVDVERCTGPGGEQQRQTRSGAPVGSCSGRSRHPSP